MKMKTVVGVSGRKKIILGLSRLFELHVLFPGDNSQIRPAVKHGLHHVQRLLAAANPQIGAGDVKLDVSRIRIGLVDYEAAQKILRIRDALETDGGIRTADNNQPLPV